MAGDAAHSSSDIHRLIAMKFDKSWLPNLLAHVYHVAIYSHLSKKSTERSADNLQLLISFLGLPDQLPKRKGEKQSWFNIGKNFIGYEPEDNWVVRFFSTLILFPYYFLRLPLKLGWNILKIFTEVIPLCLIIASEKISDSWSNQLERLSQSSEKLVIRLVKGTFLSLLFILSLFISPICYFIYFVGCSVTSPWDLIDKALFYADKEKSPWGWLFVSLIVIQTSLIYSLLLPLAFNALGGLLLPLLQQHWPVMMEVIVRVTPYLAVVGAYIHSFAQAALTFETFGLLSLVTLPPTYALTGLSFLFTVLTLFVAKPNNSINLGLLKYDVVTLQPGGCIRLRENNLSSKLNFTLNSRHDRECSNVKQVKNREVTMRIYQELPEKISVSEKNNFSTCYLKDSELVLFKRAVKNSREIMHINKSHSP